MVVERSSPLSQSSDATTATVNVAWDLIDAEFSSIISPVYSRLSSGEVRPKEAACIFASLLNAHLERHEILPLNPPSGTKPSAPPALVHRTRKIEKVVEKMKQLLSDCRKNRKKAPQAFHDACRAYSKALRAKRSLESSKNIRKHKRTFRNNPWLYAKKCCSGKSTHTEPSFSAVTAYAYFQDSTASSHQTYQTLPEWVSQVMPSPVVMS